MEREDNSKKRTRDEFEDQEADSPESKLTRVASDAVWTDSKRIQVDPLDVLDDSDGLDPPIQGLESVMKSFEEEILLPAADISFLLEASSDELSLPPSSSSIEEQKAEAVGSDVAGHATSEYGGILEFDDELPNYDSFEFGIGGDLDSLDFTPQR